MMRRIANWIRGTPKESSWQSPLPPRVLLAIAMGIWVATEILFSGPVGRFAQERFAHRLEFPLSRWLGRTPRLAPTLKAIALDDRFIDHLQRNELTAALLTRILRQLIARRPDRIYIDKVFAYRITDSEAQLQSLGELVKGPVRIITAAVATDRLLARRRQADLGDPALALNPAITTNQGVPPWLSRSYQAAYGAYEELAPLFSTVGHVHWEGGGYLRPVLRIAPDRLLPHWAIAGAEYYRINEDSVTAGDRALIPVGEDGRLLVNVLFPDQYHFVDSLVALFDKTMAEKTLAQIQPGDTVALLTGAYTGKDILAETPVGQLPASFVNLSFLNSTLTGEWIRQWEHRRALSFAMGAIAVAAVIRFSSLPFWGIVSLTSLLLFLSSLAAFTRWNLLIPWIGPLFNFLLTSTSLFALKTWLAEKRVSRIRQSLEGMVDPKKLNDLLTRSHRLDFSPRTQPLTVLFLDLVGFSLRSAHRPPAEVFAELKETLDQLNAIIHAHGGIVDKTMGDGILAFFGYEFSAAASAQTHADQAVQCALAIQNHFWKQAETAQRQGMAIFGARIGINTGKVFIGDLGGAERIEITAIGHEVNLAQRCEAAGESFQIVLSEATRQSLRPDFAQTLSAVRRSIPIKHYDEPMPAWVVNPFSNRLKDLEKIQVAMRKSFGMDRKETRFSFTAPLPVTVNARSLEGELVNYSRTGLAVRGQVYLARGSRIRLAFLDLADIVVEVRWCQAEGDRYLWGGKYLNVDTAKQDALLDQLHGLAGNAERNQLAG